MDLRALHETLSLAALAALAVDAVALLGDGFIGFGAADLATVRERLRRRLDGRGDRRRLAAAPARALLSRPRGGSASRAGARCTALAWLLGIGHALGMGTDAGTTWFVLGLIATAGPAIALLGVRLAPGARDGGAGVIEHALRFPCFGGSCSVHAGGDGAAEALAGARRQLLAWHERFTRFDPHSELARLNADPRGRVPVSRELALLAAAVADAGRRTGGLVDGTLVGALEAAGYRGDPRRPGPLPLALARRAAAGRDRAAEPARRRRADRPPSARPSTGRPAFTGIVQATRWRRPRSRPRSVPRPRC